MGVIDAMNKNLADKEAVKSNRSAYEAMLASYNYGTRTMTDVLTSETNLYQSQNDFVKDQYTYIVQTLTLKKAAGTLSTSDLVAVNQWLQHDRVKSYVPVIPINTKKNIPKASAAINKKSVSNTLKGLNPNHYVLQILAGDNEGKVLAFMRTHHLPVKMFYVTITNGDEKIYKLMAGDYNNLALAEAAKTKLAKMLNLSPWPRKVQSIQNELNN